MSDFASDDAGTQRGIPLRQRGLHGGSDDAGRLPIARIRRRPVTTAVTTVVLTTSLAHDLISLTHPRFRMPWTWALGASGVGMRTPWRRLGTPAYIHESSGVPLPSILRHLLSSAVVVNGPISLLALTAVLIPLLSLVEGRLGSRRTAAVMLTGLVTAVLTGLVVDALVLPHTPDGRWLPADSATLLSPLLPAVTSLMAAAPTFAPALRRRIVIAMYAGIASILLFGGGPGDYCLLTAAIAGQCCGSWHSTPWQGLRAFHATDTEIRHLLALAQLAFAVGPLVAVASRTHSGALTRLGLMLAIDQQDGVPSKCLSNDMPTSCLVVLGMSRLRATEMWTRSLLSLAILATIAWGLNRGRRLAALGCVATNLAISGGTVMGFALAGTESSPSVSFPYAALVPLALAIAVIAHRRSFPIRGHPCGRRVVLLILAATLAASVLGFTAYALLFPSLFRPNPDGPVLLRFIVDDLPPVSLPVATGAMTLHPLTTASSLVMTAAWISARIAILASCITVLHDVPDPGETDRESADSCVLEGGSSLGFMTTWDGNRYHVSPSGRSTTAYRVLHGVALAVAGPVGDPDDRREALKDFLDFCAWHSWTAAFYAVHDDDRRLLSDMGCLPIRVGSDMVLDPSTWQTRGRHWQDVRTAINKASRLGVTDVLTTFEEAGEDVRRQIVEISRQWSTSKPLPEMRFTLGGIPELRDRRVRLLLAIDASGRVLAVTSWLPTYLRGQVRGWTLDLMRHRSDAPNGTMEFLIARMAERLRDEIRSRKTAVEFMSLSAAPLACPDDPGHDESRAWGLLLRTAIRLLEPVYGFRSLYAFKLKFHPRPEPLSICISDPMRLGALALAIADAYIPGKGPSRLLRLMPRPSTRYAHRPGTDRRPRRYGMWR